MSESSIITAEDAERMIGNDHFNVVEQRLALTVVEQAEQIASLKRAFDQAWDRLRQANGRAADLEEALLRRRTHGPCINNPSCQCGCDDAPCPNCPGDDEEATNEMHRTRMDFRPPIYDRPCQPAGCTKPLSGGGACWCADNGYGGEGDA